MDNEHMTAMLILYVVCMAICAAAFIVLMAFAPIP